MSIQRKQGFTLIELMVVIVIIGILAAIAIPKLFGMSAKAKASEVGPAAGTWSKLMQAYAMETNSLGRFQQIAYKGPGVQDETLGPEKTQTPNFEYASNETTDLKPDDDNTTWTATAVKPLNDCAGNSTWTAKFTISDENMGINEIIIKNSASAPSAAGNDGENLIEDPKEPQVGVGDCGSLTPNFGRLQ